MVYALNRTLVRSVLSPVFPHVARWALALVYGWFGALKLTGASPATPLARELTRRMIGEKRFPVAFAVLAVVEVAIGLAALVPGWSIPVLVAVLVHMGVVCAPLVLTPKMAWDAPGVPNLEGQYIIKNAALAALAIGLAAC